jgi:hypothetical protein
MAFDVQGALKAGYSVDEIGNHVGFDVASARKAGYSDDEIMGHLSGGSSSPTPQPNPTMMQKIGSNFDKQMQDAQNISQNPNLSAPEKYLGYAGKGLNLFANTAQNVLGSIIPDSVQKGISTIVTGARRAIISDKNADFLKNEYDQFLKNNPRTGNLMNAAGNAVNAGVTLGSLNPTAEAIKEVPTLVKGGANTIKQAASNLMTKTPAEIDQGLTNIVQTGINKGIRPSVSGKGTAAAASDYYDRAKSGVKTIIDNKDNLALTDAEGNTVTGQLPQNLKQFSEAIDQTKKSIYQQYHDMATQAGGQGATFDSTGILSKLDGVSKDLKFSPDVRKYADDLKGEISELQGQTPEVIEARIADLNNSLNGFYEGRISKAKAQVDASVANQMRQELDNNIMNSQGPGYQDLKNQYGGLKTLEKDVNHRAIIDARQSPKGLINLSDIFTGGDIAAGLLTLNPALALKGIAGKGIQAWYRMSNNPNYMVGKMFKDADNLISKGASSRSASNLTANTPPVQPLVNAPTPEPSPIINPSVAIGQNSGVQTGNLTPFRVIPVGKLTPRRTIPGR